MPKEGKELLAAYKQALFEGHDPDLPWAGRTAEGWKQFKEDLKPKPKAKPEPKPEPELIVERPAPVAPPVATPPKSSRFERPKKAKKKK